MMQDSMLGVDLMLAAFYVKHMLKFLKRFFSSNAIIAKIPIM